MISVSKNSGGQWQLVRLKLCTVLGLDKDHQWHPAAMVVCQHRDQLGVTASWDGGKFVDHQWVCGACGSRPVAGPEDAEKAFNRAQNYRPYRGSTQ